MEWEGTMTFVITVNLFIVLLCGPAEVFLDKSQIRLECLSRRWSNFLHN